MTVTSPVASLAPFEAPSIEYGQLSPLLIVLGVAVVGVMVEAFLPRAVRYSTQVVLSLAGLVAALVAVVALAGTRTTAAVGSVAVDGPTLFLQGTILVISILAILLIAERGIERDAGHRVDAFAAQASSVPGTVAEKEAVKVGATQTEVYPLTMFAIGGMLLFPQMFLKSVAYGAIATVSIAALTAITVLPAMLGILGPRVDALGFKFLKKTRTADEIENGIWGRLTRWVMRHPLKVAVPIIIGLLLLIIPVSNIKFGGFTEKLLPPDSQARTAQQEFDQLKAKALACWTMLSLRACPSGEVSATSTVATTWRGNAGRLAPSK